MTEKVGKFIGHLVAAAIIILFVAVMVWVFCWSFDIVWNWKYPIGTCVAALFAIFVLQQGVCR